MTIRAQLLIKITQHQTALDDLEVKVIRAQGAEENMIRGLIAEEKACLATLKDRLQEIDHHWIMDQEHRLEGLVYRSQASAPGERALLQDEIESLRKRINDRKIATYGKAN